MNKKSFHLRWNNHLQNLQNLFENLYNEQTLVDVTISCSDGLLYGHKLVLSACSPYFEHLFKDNPCKHPILILKGIRAREMQILLQYMYVGSVDVGEDELELLLDTATELRVKGLIQEPKEDSHRSSSQQQRSENTNKSLKESFNSARTNSPNPNNLSDDLSWQAELVARPSTIKHKETGSNKLRGEVKSTVEENLDTDNIMNQIIVQPMYVKKDVKEETPGTEEYQDANEDTLQQAAESLEKSQEGTPMSFNISENNSTEVDDTIYFCHMCNRNFQSKGSYHRHMLTHAGVKPHSCTFCDQSFLRLSHLQRHIRVHTGERPYQCSRCSKQFSRSDKLRQHYIIQHNDKAGGKVSKPRGRPRKNPNSYGPPMPSSLSAITPIVFPGIDISPVPVTNPV